MNLTREEREFLLSQRKDEEPHVYPVGYPKHILSEDCWCKPYVDYTDPVTGRQVWIHKQPH